MPGAACKVSLGPLCVEALRLARAGGPERVAYLAGPPPHGGRVVAYALIPAANLEESPYGFTADPRDTLTAHHAAWNMGLDVVGVFHTHPCGAPRPSRRDLEGMRAWPLVWVIASPLGLGAYRLLDGVVEECGVDCAG